MQLLIWIQTLVNWYHSTRFSIGNPPVSFDAILDLGSSTLIVPSTHTPILKPPIRHLYNSSTSSTYVPNGTEVSGTPLCFGNNSGFLSQDDFSIVGLTVKDQLFTEATSHGFRQCLFCEPFDTVFPLGPYNSSSPLNPMSPLAQLVERNLLDENIFSLRLSRGITDSAGQLVLGGVVDKNLYDGDFITIHVTDQTREGDKRLFAGDNNWKVIAESFTFENGSGISLDFTSPTIAALDTAYPWIALPISLAKSLNEYMEAEIWGPFAWVDCSKRSKFPHVTIVLAGKNFVLSPFDYIFEQEYWDEPGKLYCQSAFVPAFEIDYGVILLGHTFLRAFVTVWDLEGKTVSCESSSSTFWGICRTKLRQLQVQNILIMCFRKINGRRLLSTNLTLLCHIWPPRPCQYVVSFPRTLNVLQQRPSHPLL